MEYHTFGVALRTLRCRWFGRTDVGRWADTAGFEDTWRDRARLIADLVPPGSSVVDFGAGRRVLESCLAGKATYIPHDVVGRGPDSMVFDLNDRPLPELTYLNLDVAVLAGVLEYIRDIGSFLRWLSRHASLCIASYECARSRPMTFDRVGETIQRICAGWVNSFTEDQLLLMFQSCGFTLKGRHVWHTPAGDEPIFVLRSLKKQRVRQARR
jgi:hypothetical protein